MRASSPATPMPRTRLSACSSRPLKLFGKACPRESGGQGRQAHRIRQNGQIAGGGEPDRRRLRSLRSAAQRRGPAARRDRNASSNAGLHAAPGGGGCRLLFGQERGGRKSQGLKRVCIPNRSTKSPERKREQKKRWFRNGQKWRTGCEGRISVVKRRHGLGRSRYKGDAGIKRWVGLGVIADNLVNISRAMAKQPSR